ncbi:hypothetical protein EB796_014074 [Bugula neritina]|uniref:DDE Tnp4 domain-containing protein n=1 Tax=Bugula neritina TaxID=10212 RepID=A0A7J7JMQ1_BUGNE|nr:hypothetical protein EB796_014074 [Bugula neritina]
MRPYPGRSINTQEKKVFNYRLSRARRVVENAFGIMSQRWRILVKMMCASQAKAVKVVQGLCVLHNFLRIVGDPTYVPPGYADTPREDGVIQEGFWRAEASGVQGATNFNRSNNLDGVIVRNRFCNYFSSRDGNVPW